jgi:large subunit ribosomal protein L23
VRTVLLPVVSEKAVALADAERTYLFLVDKNSNKVEVARAVNERFKVKVEAVNIAVVKGKPKAGLVKRGSRRIKGRRSDVKKAYVRLKEGESIKLFEEEKK